jgi:putative glycosyltransferase
MTWSNNKISFVTSLYRSSAYVHEFYERYLACAKKLGVDYEFVFVDDGSPDDSADKVRELVARDEHVKLVLFSRNFGQYPAMFAAIAHATGNWIFTSDADLEEAPENIYQFWEHVKDQDKYDVIYGLVTKRIGGFVKNFLGGMFFKLLKWGADADIPENMSWQILMHRDYAKVLGQYHETETLPAGLLILTGFRKHYLYIEKPYKGSTTYTFKKRMKLAVNSITAFSSKPLVYIGLFGISVTIVSFIAAAVSIVLKLFFIDYQSGWISIILSIWLVGGLILSSIGVVGIYLAKVFNQVKQRPLYVVRKIEQKSPASNN